METLYGYFDLNICMEYIAKVFALTSTIKQVYATLFVPVIKVALTPVGGEVHH